MTPPALPTLSEEAREVPERALRLYARLWQFETWLRTIVYVELRALLGDGWTHDRLVHVTLDTGDAIRLTIPAVLGSNEVIELVETWLGAARHANAIAAEWPEYVLGPGHPLAHLGPDMPCSFFDA